MESQKQTKTNTKKTQGQRVPDAEGPGNSKAKITVPKAEGQGASGENPNAERPGISKEISQADRQGNKMAVRVTALEDVDLMTDEEIRAAKLSGVSKAKISRLVKQGQDYVQAKRAVIKANFIKATERAKEMQSKPIKAMTKVIQTQKIDGPKRLRSDGSTPPESQRKGKRPRTEGVTFSEAAASVKVAVVLTGFPEAKMDIDKLKAVEIAILGAYDKILEAGPQVRFLKSTYRPGFLELNCADDISARWLKEVIPTLRPWESASLRAVEGEDIPKPHSCTVFVQDEHGERLESKRILNRLRISNHGLRTHLWTVWGSKPLEKGVLWTFSMDSESREELQKLKMSPFFGVGRLTFRPKEGKTKTRNEKPVATRSSETGETSLHMEVQDEEQPSSGGDDTPIRTNVQECVGPTEEGMSTDPEPAISSQ
ncbi:uncharacterized protein [Diabrotica undecimpunctata]|uniref:uncharacterized protein n=1 Tax=Diabrotica undecimpunctata TaxID=50387 RepID=UPI003B634496